MVNRVLTAVSIFFDRAARVCLYAAAGVLSFGELRRAVEANWETFHNDEESMNAGLYPAERHFVEQHVKAASRILLVGCGSGRETIALASEGFRVTGVEPARRTLDQCRHALRSRELEADLRNDYVEDVSLDGDVFDVVMFTFGVYSFIPSAARRVATLTKVARALRPGGLILVSYREIEAPSHWLTGIARAAGALSRSDWRLEPGDAVYRTTPGALGFEHVFTRSELDQELAEAGLTQLEGSPFPSYPYVLARLAGQR
jgi:SAM-dependent methyltransferase